MIARSKSYVFTEIFLAIFLLDTPFWTAQFLFCIYGFQNKNRAAQNVGLLENIAGNISCENNTEMKSAFRLDNITLEFFRYTLYLLTENFRKASNFTYQDLVLLFPTYVIIYFLSTYKYGN